MTNLSNKMKAQAKLSGRSNEINQVPQKNSLLVEGAEMIEQQHVRGLELAKALSTCITAMNPLDRDGISMSEWNQRLKAATKQACAVFDGRVNVPAEK